LTGLLEAKKRVIGNGVRRGDMGGGGGGGRFLTILYEGIILKG